MSAVLADTYEPSSRDRLGARIARMYCGTLFGTAMWLAYFPNECASDLLIATARRRKLEGCRPFDPIDGKACSWSYYTRRSLTDSQRLEREREARGDRMCALLRRQAA